MEEDDQTLYFIIKLLLSLFKNWNNLWDVMNKILAKNNADLEEKNKEIKDLKSELEDIKTNFDSKLEKEKAKFEGKPLMIELTKIKEKYSQLSQGINKEKKELNNQIANLTAANNKLTEEIKDIEIRSDRTKFTATMQQLRNELHQTEEMLKKEKEEKSSIGYTLHTLLDAQTNEVRNRDSIILKKDKELSELSQKYEEIKVNLQEVKGLLSSNIENMKMTAEDNLQVKLTFLKKNREILMRDNFIKTCTDKLNEMEQTLKQEREGLIQKKNISIEGSIYNFFSNISFGKDNNKNKSMARECKQKAQDEFETINETEHKIAEKLSESGDVMLNSIDLNKYNYSRPTYRAMLNISPPEGKNKIEFVPPFPIWLQVTIRAIFDAKLNELLQSYSRGQTLTSFPEFVFAWMGAFCIDKETKNIRILDRIERDTIALENKKNLLYALESQSDTTLWEVLIFKDFLEEKLSSDELAFFLHCRFLLFKGLHLSMPTANLCVRQFVTKDRVLDTIDRALIKYKPEEREEFKNNLIEFNKETYKDANAFDYAMVLRILLELYRKEKKENCLRLQGLFSKAKTGGQNVKFSLTFESFRDVFAGEYDRDISELDLAYLFREAYIAGGGTVNLESTLVTLCNSYLILDYI